MKKRSRRPRSSESPGQTSRSQTSRSQTSRSQTSRSQTSRSQTSGGVAEEKRTPGNRGRPKKTVPVTTETFYHHDAAKDKTADSDGGVTTPKPAESKSRSSGRLSAAAAACRLCHGKFSPRSLRHAFNKWPQDSLPLVDAGDAGDSDSAAQSPLLFHTDFQRLVGVQMDRDPRLSEFICKKCHSKFYKCHSILVRFLQRVNLPVGNLQTWEKSAAAAATPTAPQNLTSDPKCLHSLVSWAHHHGEACRSCPDLKEVLEDQCWGSVKAVWGCVDGHSYVMDTQSTAAAANPEFGLYGRRLVGGGDGVMSEEEEEEEEEEEQQQQPDGFERTAAGSVSAPDQAPGSGLDWTGDAEDFTGHEAALSPALVQLEEPAADSDLSDRFMCEEDFEESRKLSDDDMFQPYADKRPRRVAVPNKRRRNQKSLQEPKVKKKPGPKPGWKNKFKPKGEELPNIYKCPYQGCTAVYRAADGLKKHIKEHHEEVKERPCPHPGCNKVFMIDRYLQRHVKLIHTEERNYICDQCGQTFKQRKHLSVHQMRHSGAKPLQCEVCGFQCRQRASLKYHMTKHKAEADLEFACLMCGKRFEKAHNLNVHMSMVHPLIQAKVQRGGGDGGGPEQQQQQQQQQQPPPYSDLHAITLSGDMVQQDQDR